MAAVATDADQVMDLAETVVTLMRTFGRAKARLLAAAEHDVEWAAQILLRHLHTEGPMRAGALAEVLHSDPSTVSRQVAALVREGLIERRADPQDGRASILVPTPAADVVLADHDHRRTEFFTRLVSGWDAADVETFAVLLQRFTQDFAHASTAMIDERSAGTGRLRALEGK